MKDEFNINIDELKFLSLKQEIKQLFSNILKEKNLNASGQLDETAEVVFNYEGDDFVIYLNLQDYYKFTDQGVNGTEINHGSPFSFSGKPISTKIIEDWIIVKKIVPAPGKNGKIPSTTELAYMMSRSIPRKGIEPRHFIDEMKKRTEEQIKYKVINIIYEQLTKNIKV